MEDAMFHLGHVQRSLHAALEQVKSKDEHEGVTKLHDYSAKLMTAVRQVIR